MVQQRQLFAEVKVRKGELQFCETPFTHYHLSPAPSTNKGQVHYSLLGEKKNSLKKPRPSQWQLVRASRHQIPQETNRHYMELILEKIQKWYLAEFSTSLLQSCLEKERRDVTKARPRAWQEETEGSAAGHGLVGSCCTDQKPPNQKNPPVEGYLKREKKHAA